jgi:signal transduction histidine kinase
MARVSKPYARVVFRNLINNAVKYSPPKGKVSIKVYLSGQDIVVSISDEGIGIPPESIDKIWNELFIGSSSRMDPFSKGFGLPIVKKIVELHDGRIEAFSEGSMKGATFTVYLPRTDKDT